MHQYIKPMQNSFGSEEGTFMLWSAKLVEPILKSQRRDLLSRNNTVVFAQQIPIGLRNRLVEL